MRVDHLNCGVMEPIGTKAMVAHVFLVDPLDGSGLILVDTGFGSADVESPAKRLGFTRHILGAKLDHQHTAVSQLRERGIAPSDVAHIVLTHFDLDHVGGLADFPEARVHATAAEHEAALVSPRGREKSRYRDIQFSHKPHFELHEGRGDVWRDGLTGHEVVPGVTLIPFPGHTRGHAAVAVDAGERGLLVHAGDSVYDASSYTDVSVSGKALTRVAGWRASENFMAVDKAAVARNHETLRMLHANDGVTVVNAHDPRMFEGLQGVNQH